MADTTQIVTNVNQKIVGAITGVSWLNVIGWLAFIIVSVGGAWWVYVFYKNKKLFNKKITALEIIGGEWKPCIKDTAKVVKIGKGGFEILFLKKAKTWKIAYGGRSGRSDYYFFIMPDGYWYNGTFSANINWIDQQGGLIPIKTTNPLMRGQYTALEKQIDTLHADKQKFWDKYGTFILSVAFILIAGVLLWLMFKEFHSALGELANYHTKLSEILDKINNLATNIQAGQPNENLIPA